MTALVSFSIQGYFPLEKEEDLAATHLFLGRGHKLAAQGSTQPEDVPVWPARRSKNQGIHSSIIHSSQ